jgi:2-amino-4-hydroxy-6-hydroxymethyldihydropteridine diphosphokinase
MPAIAYLSLGANLGDREASLAEAIRRLRERGIQVTKQSSLYETEPRDFLDQPWFLNMAIEAETALEPRDLLAAVLAVEADMGRTRTSPKGPRTIDIDILLYGSAIVATDALEIPHPRLCERRFVLEPLIEIVPELRDPRSGRLYRELLKNVEGQVVRRLSHHA